MKKILLGLVGFLMVTSSFAVSTIKEGVDYTVIPSVAKPTAKPKKVNVKEFFSFTCIHCKDVEPLIDNYVASNKNIELDKIHVIWGNDQSMVADAKLNATVQLLQLNKLYVPIFNAIFSGQKFNDMDTLKKFLASNGLNKDQISKFMDAYNSFDVSSTIGRYKTMTADPVYDLKGTPTFIVADKYIVSPAQPPRLIEVIKELVAMQGVPTKSQETHTSKKTEVTKTHEKHVAKKIETKNKGESL